MNIVILVLGLLSAFGPLSIDMYLPALPGIAEDLNVGLSSVQLSLASFFIGIAVGQIFYGPITDRFGRKKPLYVGLILYGIASFLCAVSSNVEGLIIYRFVQALGSCAGMVISRAMVRDLYRPHESAKVFSLLMLVMGVAPILAPLAGGLMMNSFGWRSIFWFLTLISCITFFCVFFFLKETAVPHPDHRLSRAFHNYLDVLKDRQFVGYAFSLSFIYAGMFTYITGSPFVFIEHYGLTTGEYSLLFGFNASGLILFSQINARMLRYHSPERLIRFTLPFTAIAGFLLFLVGQFNGSLWAMCLPLFFFILTMGIIAPNAAACALAYQKKSAGSASAMLGTIQFSTSAICSSLVSQLHDGTIAPMTSVIFICALSSLFFYWLLVLRKNAVSILS
jgi:DHA1 family bicyclomycin/chloramphenicol resistance-like MFS transporter